MQRETLGEFIATFIFLGIPFFMMIGGLIHAIK